MRQVRLPRARALDAHHRRKAAKFPTGKSLDVWDENASSIPLPTQHAHAPWNGSRAGRIWWCVGRAGTGMEVSLEALGHNVIEADMPAAWF